MMILDMMNYKNFYPLYKKNMAITHRKKRVIDESKQSPSEFILPGTWFGSDIPAVKTGDQELYKKSQWTWLDRQYNLWETELKPSPNETIWGQIKQTFRNLRGNLNFSWRIEAKDRLIKESAEEARKKALEWWALIQQWEVLEGVWKNISASVAWIAVPFTSTLNEEVTGKFWEVAGKLLGMPFEILHFNISNTLALAWMDKGNANNYSEWIATLALFWARWGKNKETTLAETARLTETFKRWDIKPELKQQFNREALKMHPDPYLSKWFSKERISDITTNFAEYNNAFRKWDKIGMDLYKAKTESIIKAENSRLIKEGLKNTRASLDLWAFMKNQKELTAYNKLKAEIKQDISLSKWPVNIQNLVSEKMFWLFIDNVPLEQKIQNQMVQELFEDVGEQSPIAEIKNEIEFEQSEITEIRNQLEEVFNEWNPELLPESIEYIDSMPDSLVEIKNLRKSFEDLIKYQEQTQIIWKDSNLRQQYWKDLTSAMSGLYLNQSKAISQKALDKYTDISNNYPKVAEKIEEYITQNQLEDITAQSIYESFVEIKTARKSRIKKPTLKEKIPEAKISEIIEAPKTPEIPKIVRKKRSVKKEELKEAIQSQLEGVKIESVKKESKIPTLKKIQDTKKFDKFAKKLAEIEKDPTQTDIAKLLNDMQWVQIKDVTKYALEKNMITKEFAEFATKAIKEKIKSTPQAPTGKINDTQKMHILDMLGYNSIFKPLWELKINVPELSKSLKNIDARMHIVNSPEGSRVKLPFSLMGNKSTTYRQVLLPMVKKATQQGAKTYVEPFGGAGTVYYFADEMIASGIEEMHINHFDNEKYQVIKALKDWTVWNVTALVDKAYNQIIWEMWSELSHIPEIKEIMDNYWIEVWSKEFKEIAEMSFSPQYAKQFFEERPDTKLWVNGELSIAFKDWLREHLAKESEKAWIKLEWEKLDTAVEVVLNDQSVFENKYPEISKKVSTILDKYDNINIKDWDVTNAMLVSMSRHFRQRWDSGQKVVSASGWFQNVFNVRNKMVDWLTKYQKVFQKHWDKISIYNQDGKKFVTNMWKTLNTPETITYSDPPYIRTTGVYIKNQPAEIKWALEEYADTSKIHQLFEPMKDSIMMFTNDINWPYFEALNTMLEGRMSKDIIGYREWTTPTSLVTTNEIAVKPKDVGLSYYNPIKDRFTKDMWNALRESLFPKIATQQKKILAKFEQHFMDLMKDKFWDLTKIQDQQFKGKQAFEDLQASLETVVSWKDKQKIISEAKKWLKQNIVTGKDVSTMIDKINKLWVDRQKLATGVRKQVDKLKVTSTIDIESKKAFFEWFNKEYSLKKIPESRGKEVQAVDKIMNWEDFTPGEFEIFEKYLSDEKFYDKIEDARKKSIYQLDIDSLNTLSDTIKYYETVGKDYRNFKDQELNNVIEAERIKAEPQLKKIESTKPLSIQESLSKSNRLKEIGIKAKVKTKQALIDATPMEWLLDEELNLSRTAYNFIEKPINKHRDNLEQSAIDFDTLSKELNISAEWFKKITLHGLARRSDWKGKIKIIARMKKAWEDVSTYSDQLQKFSDENFLSENEKKMYDHMQSVFKSMGKEMQKTKILLDNEMVTLMDEYFPIQMDWASNQDKFADTIDPNAIDNGSDLFRKTKTEQWFTKEATALEIVPELDASKIFRKHVSNVSYYTNMQKPIKQLNQLVNTWGKDKLWDLGYKFMKDYLDVLSRQWVMWIQTGFDRIISAWVRNFQSAVLWFNPTTMALQTSAIMEAVAIWWNVDLGAYKDVVKAITGKKEVWNMITEKSGVIRNREYKNLFWNTTDKFDKGIMDKWNTYGFYWIQKADAVISRVVWYSEYKRSLKQWATEVDAVYNADTMIKKAMWHTHFEWKALFVLKNERKASSVATVFQNFVLNHSAMMRYGWGKKVQAKYGKVMWYAYSLFFAGLMFAMYEELIRTAWRKLHKQKDFGSPEEKALSQMIWFIPYAWILHWGARYDSINILSGWRDISKWFDWNKEWITWAKVLKWLWTVMWVWWTAEMNRIYNWYFKESKKKKIPVKTLGRGGSKSRKRRK